jgi:hypothetical protein
VSDAITWSTVHDAVLQLAADLDVDQLDGAHAGPGEHPGGPAPR